MVKPGRTYPPDGVGSAIIDGGAASASTGLDLGIYIHGGSNITINGLQFQNYRSAGLQAGADFGAASPNATFINNIVHDNYDPQHTGLISVFGDAQNATVANNYVYNAVNHGIVMQASGENAIPHGISGGTIENNYIYNTGELSTDSGAIYLQDWAGGIDATQRSTNSPFKITSSVMLRR